MRFTWLVGKRRIQACACFCGEDPRRLYVSPFHKIGLGALCVEILRSTFVLQLCELLFGFRSGSAASKSNVWTQLQRQRCTSRRDLDAQHSANQHRENNCFPDRRLMRNLPALPDVSRHPCIGSRMQGSLSRVCQIIGRFCTKRLVNGRQRLCIFYGFFLACYMIAVRPWKCSKLKFFWFPSWIFQFEASARLSVSIRLRPRTFYTHRFCGRNFPFRLLAHWTCSVDAYGQDLRPIYAVPGSADDTAGLFPWMPAGSSRPSLRWWHKAARHAAAQHADQERSRGAARQQPPTHFCDPHAWNECIFQSCYFLCRRRSSSGMPWSPTTLHVT